MLSLKVEWVDEINVLPIYVVLNFAPSPTWNNPDYLYMIGKFQEYLVNWSCNERQSAILVKKNLTCVDHQRNYWSYQQEKPDSLADKCEQYGRTQSFHFFYNKTQLIIYTNSIIGPHQLTLWQYMLFNFMQPIRI